MDETQYREATIQLPEAASTLAPHVDQLYSHIFWISVVFFVGIVGCMTWFAYRYRRRPGVQARPPGHHNALELFWTFSPLLILAYMFHQGFEGYMFMSVPPENAVNIRVQGSSWAWSFEQPNGMTDTEMVVPVGRPVRLIMSSHGTEEQPAVIHSFFVPAFRIKRDVVPGMFTSMWFEATRTGDYQVFCTEYCGTGHSVMGANIRVVSQQAYQRYLDVGPSRPDQYENDAEWGEALFASSGCTACHRHAEGAGRLVGPNLWGVAGTQQPIEGGEPVLADLAYLRESITMPAAKIVEGYPNRMASYAHLPQSLTDALVAYLASISPEGDSVAEELAAQADGATGG